MGAVGTRRRQDRGRTVSLVGDPGNRAELASREGGWHRDLRDSGRVARRWPNSTVGTFDRAVLVKRLGGGRSCGRGHGWLVSARTAFRSAVRDPDMDASAVSQPKLMLVRERCDLRVDTSPTRRNVRDVSERTPPAMGPRA